MSETKLCANVDNGAFRESERCAKQCAMCASVDTTPPTPDRAAVRDAILDALVDADTIGSHSARLARLLALPLATWTLEQVADTLAAVSRPAEARGEPTDAEVDAALKSLEVTHHWNTPTRDRVRLALKCANQAAAPRPEPGEVTDEQLCDLYRAHWQTRVDNAELIKAEAMLFAFVRAALAAREGA